MQQASSTSPIIRSPSGPCGGICTNGFVTTLTTQSRREVGRRPRPFRPRRLRDCPSVLPVYLDCGAGSRWGPGVRAFSSRPAFRVVVPVDK